MTTATETATRTERARFVVYSRFGVEQGYFFNVEVPATATIAETLMLAESKGFAEARADGFTTANEALSFDTYLL